MTLKFSLKAHLITIRQSHLGWLLPNPNIIIQYRGKGLCLGVLHEMFFRHFCDWLWSVFRARRAVFDENCAKLSGDCASWIGPSFGRPPNGEQVRKLDLPKVPPRTLHCYSWLRPRCGIFWGQNQNWFPRRSDWWVISIIIREAVSSWDGRQAGWP